MYIQEIINNTKKLSIKYFLELQQYFRKMSFFETLLKVIIISIVLFTLSYFAQYIIKFIAIIIFISIIIAAFWKF